MPSLLRVHVVPNAKATALAGRHGDALKVKVAAPPSEGRANQALTEHIAEALGLPKRAVRVKAGAQGREKLLEIDGLEPEALQRWVQAQV